MLKILGDLGFSQSDSRVYIFLAKRGSHKAGDLAKSLRIGRQTLYFTIKNLQKKGIVISSLQHPAKFSAVPIEKVLDLFVKNRLEEVQQIQSRKNEILSDWKTIAFPEPEENSPKFTVIEGRGNIYSKIQQMLEETENRFDFITSVTDLMRIDEFGLFNVASGLDSRSRIRFRFLTELSDNDIPYIKALLAKKEINVKGRTQDSGLSLPTRMVIRDESEALFFLTSKTKALLPTQDNICLWTNCRSLVQSFSAMFEDLWHNSIDIQKRMEEIETGELTSRTYIIDEVDVARRKYLETVQSAKHELLVMTSSSGLVGIWKKLPLAALAEKGVGTRIMAPITSDNLGVARDISKHATVKHISPNYLETTIVDGTHLFQTNQELTEGSSASDKFSENTIYTSDPEHVKRARNMLNILWENARVPPILSLECAPSIAGASLPVSDEEYSFSKPFSPYRKMTTFVDEKPRLKPEEVLSKIISARKYPVENWPKDIIIQYGSGASAVIHPPKEFGLPDMMFFVQHHNKSSSCGAEDCLLVYTFDGQKYNPAAYVSDNSKGGEIRDLTYAGTHMEGNMQIVKKDQLQVQIHGNTVFAGWSVPIPLHPGGFWIPPSCLLIEGYGQLKSGEISFRLPSSGIERTVEYNGYEAFVTFYHPTSRYIGPGTDGIVSRDLIQTTYPPSFKQKKKT